MADDDVVNGFWYNWEHGKTRGATLTLPPYAALILGSFLTLWVQFAGACFWRVLCFVIHQIRSNAKPQSGLFHQQQVLLRNSVTAPNTLWGLIRSGIAWRGRSKRGFRDTVPLIVTALCTIAFFGAASLLASRITSVDDNQVLLRSRACGFPRERGNVRDTVTASLAPSDLLAFNALAVMGRTTLTKSMAYARTCYGTSESSGECKTFVKPTLMGVNASAVTNASCPFGNGACAEAAVKFDSGHVHSNIDLGLNAPQRDALTIRRVTSCAPIASKKYATGWRDNVPEAFGGGKTNTSVKFYEFGTTTKSDSAVGEPNTVVLNCDATFQRFITNQTTFCVSQYMRDYLEKAYRIRASTVYQDNANASDFAPVPDFQVPDADVTLISIFNKARYIGAVNDSLFNAQNITKLRDNEFATVTEDLSVLGCTEQYQFCNAETQQCTPLAGLYKTRATLESDALRLSPYQTASAAILWKTAWSMALQWACEVLSESLLLAQDSVFTVKSTTSAALPDKHWQREAWNLHNISLAVLQRRLYEHAVPTNITIQAGVSSLSYLDTPTDAQSLDLCRRQKTRSNASISISVLGMSIILVVGSLLILLDWFFIQQILWFRSLTHHARSAKKADWTSSGMLQLQKQVFETRGLEGWTTDTADMAFPVLVENDRVFRHLGIREEKSEGGVMHVDTGYGARRRSAMVGREEVEYAALNPEEKRFDRNV
ncbi:hypothetical protein DM02DRAFT_663022 [Periconia macrospinosa]|uniref:Uncharacterized protein n=1 Tax=Periconia macrospinosa TaxID=97972 RepID=A0A2V1D4E7_9PLEO|nr:hypothetical protein DM02DRAFT_663022 [Periconia macrospinosa]